jgi:hypothetical protein
MEPRGCNRWQPVAKRSRLKRARTSQTVAVGCDRLPRPQNGKEGVSGSSQEEGSAKFLQIRTFLISSILHQFQHASDMKPIMELPDQRRCSPSPCTRRSSALMVRPGPDRAGREMTA